MEQGKDKNIKIPVESSDSEDRRNFLVASLGLAGGSAAGLLGMIPSATAVSGSARTSSYLPPDVPNWSKHWGLV